MLSDDFIESREKSRIYAIIAYQADKIVTSSGQNYDAFINTFLSNQQKALYKGDRAYRILYTMIAVAIYRIRERIETLLPLLGTLRVYSNTTIYQDSLQKVSRNWRKFQNHLYKSQFTKAVYKEV